MEGVPRPSQPDVLVFTGALRTNDNTKVNIRAEGPTGPSAPAAGTSIGTMHFAAF